MPEAVAADPTQAAELVALGVKAATAYHRPDLAARLSSLERRLSNHEVLVLVAGEYKHGKSSLINAILGAELCPVDDDRATAVPVVVRHAPTVEAVAVLRDDAGGHDRRERLPLEALPARVLEAGDDPVGLRTVEIGVPSPLLDGGVALVDAPGAGGLGGTLAAMTMALVPFVDGVMFVSDAGSELTASEMAVLRRVLDVCTHVVVVESKIDLHPHWRRIAELDRGHLEAAGLNLPVVAASARLRHLAMEAGDDVLDDESGVPVVLDWWLGETADDVANRGAGEAVRAVAEVTGLLRQQFEAERRALVDPTALSELAATTARAVADVDSARTATGRWGQVLVDALGDFNSDVDHDLRERIRALCAMSDAALDAVDPASAWSEFERRLRADVAESVSAHGTWRHERLVACVARVQEVFASEGAGEGGNGTGAEGGETVPLLTDTTIDMGERARNEVQLDVSKSGLGSQAMMLLRSSVGGVVTFSVIGGLAGLAVSAPVMVGLGLVMGSKGLKDERTRQLAQRRAQAKLSARRYLDEVLFLLGKESRDAMRAVQRELREHFAVRAEEAMQGARAALAAAQQAQGGSDEDRARRVADIDAELRRLDLLAQRAAVLTGAA